jgi:hypothetical protein
MKIYSCVGPGFGEENGHGAEYFQSKFAALAAARRASAPDRETGHPGTEVSVWVDVADRLTLPLAVAMLNGVGWSQGTRKVAVVRRGRVVAGSGDREVPDAAE